MVDRGRRSGEACGCGGRRSSVDIEENNVFLDGWYDIEFMNGMGCSLCNVLYEGVGTDIPV